MLANAGAWPGWVAPGTDIDRVIQRVITLPHCSGRRCRKITVIILL